MLDMGFSNHNSVTLSQRSALIVSDPLECHVMKEVQRLSRDLLGRDFIKSPLEVSELTANKRFNKSLTFVRKVTRRKNLPPFCKTLGRDPRPESSRQMIRTIIFANKRICEDLSWKLRKDQWPCVALHGDKSQAERDRALFRFQTRAIHQFSFAQTLLLVV